MLPSIRVFRTTDLLSAALL